MTTPSLVLRSRAASADLRPALALTVLLTGLALAAAGYLAVAVLVVRAVLAAL